MYVTYRMELSHSFCVNWGWWNWHGQNRLPVSVFCVVSSYNNKSIIIVHTIHHRNNIIPSTHQHHMCALCRYKKQFLFNKITTTMERTNSHPPHQQTSPNGVSPYSWWCIPSQQLHRSTAKGHLQVEGASTDAIVTLQVLAVLI